MGRLFVQFVDDEVVAKYACMHCGCDIASEASLLWEGYMAQCTPALLFRCAVNLSPCSPKREETLSTGRYTLVDVRCHVCCVKLGWRYLQAEREEQKYKEGAVLLQQGLLERVNSMQALRRPALPRHLTAPHGQQAAPPSPPGPPSPPSLQQPLG